MSDFASALPVRTENAGDVIVKLCDPTTTTHQASVSAAGELSVLVTNTSGSPVEIRALTSTDVVTANQGAANTSTNGWPVKLTDGTTDAQITAGHALKVSVIDAIPTGSNTIGAVTQASGPWTMDLTKVGGTSISLGQAAMAASIPVVIANNQGKLGVDLSDAAGNGITSGTQGAAQALDVEMWANGAVVSNANPIPVVISSATLGTDVLDYATATVAPTFTSTHTYTVTALKTLTLHKVFAASSGKIKVEVKIAGATKVVMFNSTATPCVEYAFTMPQSVAAAATVVMIITNLDKNAEDVYSTIEGVEA